MIKKFREWESRIAIKIKERGIDINDVSQKFLFDCYKLELSIDYVIATIFFIEDV